MTDQQAPVVPQQKEKPVPVDIKTLAEVVAGLRREDRHAQLLALLGSEKAVERFITVSIHFLSGNSEVMTKCTPQSIMEAVREAATLDLEPTGILGEAWIVRHGDKAVLRIGWRGFLKLIRRDPENVGVDVQLVYENDSFDIALGTNPFINHTPSKGKERGNYLGAYAWSKTRRGEFTIEWMTQADIEEVRKMSQMKNAGAWKDWWGEMARKSVVRRMAKRLPLHTVAAQALAVDEDGDKIESGEDTEVRATRRQTLELLAGATGADKQELTEEELIKKALEDAKEDDAEAQSEQ